MMLARSPPGSTPLAAARYPQIPVTQPGAQGDDCAPLAGKPSRAHRIEANDR
jgi:hypothetical protein